MAHGQKLRNAQVKAEASPLVLDWSEVWDAAEDPIRAKVEEVRTLFAAKGTQVSQVETIDGRDDAWGFLVFVGERTDGNAPYVVEFTLDDGAESDGERGDFFVNCQAEAMGGRTVARYCPGNFCGEDGGLYLRAIPEILERIEACDMAEIARAVLEDAEREKISLV